MNWGKKVQTQNVMLVDKEIEPTLNGIARKLNFVPLYFKWRQFANISTVAIKTAASPPNKRNVRKIIESVKFKRNFERGKMIIIRGAIKTAKRNKSKNCHEKTSVFRLNKANAKPEHPKTAMESL